MSEVLTRFLDGAWVRDFAWGVADCLLFPADWCVAAGGPDPAAGFRGRYRTRLGAVRLVNRAGGLLALAQAQMAAAGFLELEGAPPAGAVGLVEVVTPRGLGLVGAVFDGAMWNVRGLEGLAAGPFRPLKVWGVTCLSS